MALDSTVRPLSELAERYEQTSDNRIAVEAMLGYLPLPAPTMIARADAVFVTVTDVDDLGQWLRELGGKIHRSSAADGLELWTLLTLTPPSRRRERVRVRVSVPVPMGENVMDYIRAAVAA
ncbi:hypothetical protein ABZ869_01420 [Streptomyces sp. NPDC046928]|uniref:hypothetical protein n=1 Tax=Streptomyces sp. NPDC046928 TaxID=3155021 RepID=UPI0033C8B472